MATIIDEFLIKIGLDPSGVAAGRKKSSEEFRKAKEDAINTGRAMEAEGKRGAEFFRQLTLAAGAFAKVAATIVSVRFATELTKDAAAVGRFADSMGLATDRVSSFEQVFRRAGSSAQGARGALQAIGDLYSGFKLGQPDTARAGILNAISQNSGLAISLEDLADQGEGLLKVSEALSRITDARTRTSLAKQFFGTDDPGAISVLVEGAANFREELARTTPITRDQAESAARLQARWSELLESFKQGALTVLERLMPSLEKLAEWGKNAITWLSSSKSGVRELGAAFVGLIESVDNLFRNADEAKWSGWARIISGAAEIITLVFLEAQAAIEGLNRLRGVPIPADGAINTLKRYAGGESLQSIMAGRRSSVGTAPGETPQGPVQGTAYEQALALIKRREGYRENAYWDVNAFRAGYGSDTITDPVTGATSRVTSSSRVTRAQAEADLARRVRLEFGPSAQRAAGNQWAGLGSDAQAALISLAYNYGSIPQSVRTAIATGDRNKIADAISALQYQNGGINQDRRLEEARILRGSGAAGGLGFSTSGLPSLSSLYSGNISQGYHLPGGSVTINNLNIHTQATDALGISRSIDGALRQQLTPLANTGLQ